MAKSKINQVLQCTEFQMEAAKEEITKNKRWLVEKLRSMADRIEQEQGFDYIDPMDVCRIDSYVKTIAKAAENLKALKETKMMLDFIAKDE